MAVSVRTLWAVSPVFVVMVGQGRYVNRTSMNASRILAAMERLALMLSTPFLVPVFLAIRVLSVKPISTSVPQILARMAVFVQTG
jgi:hypothetical protein